MSEQEYGYDTHNMHFFTDETLTIEVDMSEVPREEIEKVLGGVPIVRCKDCKYYCKSLIDEATNLPMCGAWSAPQKQDGFCNYGERMDEEKE